jgi:hypothetical protein
MSIINSSERAALEMKLRSVLGAGVATTVLLRLLDHVNTSASTPVEYEAVPDEELSTPAEPIDQPIVEEPA